MSTALMSPFNVTRASHLVLTSCDLAKSRDFYTEVVGFKVSHETANAIHFRGVEERAHHCLTLKKARAEPLCERIGLRVLTDQDLEQAKVFFEAAGLIARFVNVPFQGRTLHVADGTRIPLELCARMKTFARESRRSHDVRGAGALRLDHFQVLVTDVESAVRAYLDLGFRPSDVRRIDRQVVGMLLHRKGNPHDIVFQQGDGPRLGHFGCIVQDIQSMMRGLDAARNLGFADALEFGPAHCGYSQRVYLRDPDGHRIALLLPPPQMIDIDEEPVVHDVENDERMTRDLALSPAYAENATAFDGVHVVTSVGQSTSKPRQVGGRSGLREAATPYESQVCVGREELAV